MSLDGSLTGFEVNLPLYYGVATRFGADMHLVGSETVTAGISMFLEEVPEEREEDLEKPDREGILWVVPDSRGKLQGLLHVFRQFDYCRDVVILVSGSTPESYLQYLAERDYAHYVVGSERCDLKQGLELLRETYGAKTVLTDTGPTLGNLLIRERLAGKISLLVHPVIAGTRSVTMFHHIDQTIHLKLDASETFEGDYLWLLYSVEP